MKALKFLFFIVFCACTSVFAQQDSVNLKTILDKTKVLSEEQPIEKVYLHFDKPYYAVADTIWFKAYTTTQFNLPSPLSKIVYVDLYNDSDSLMQSLKLPLKNGTAAGHIPLPVNSFKQGNYYVRAYTLWMLNFDQDYFFVKNIVLGEAVDKELLTNIVFADTQADKGIKTTARIQFKTPSKKPLANKTVMWRVFHDYDVFSRGKGVTDANGILTINVTSKADDPIKNGLIVTDVSLTDKELASASFKLKQQLKDMDVQVFPEGGELLAGIPNQIGFKAVKNNGLGADVSLVLTNEQGQELLKANSAFAGIGSFVFSPEAGKSYKIKVQSKDGLSKQISLPLAKEGIGLAAVGPTAPDFVTLKVQSTGSFFASNKGKSFHLIGQSNNVVAYAASFQLSAQTANIKVPKKDFPSGIAQFTLFDQDKQALSERLVFVYHKNELVINTKTDLPSYKPHQKVKLSIVAQHAGQNTMGDFSISVTDEQKVPIDEDKETTILSSLLLSSDLKGYIEKPNYYFNKTDDKKLVDLDRLMLTQGYRRFSYKEIINGQYPKVFLLPEQGITISGTLRDLTGMPIRKGIMRMMVTGKPISSEITTSNMGVFRFEQLNFPDSSQVVVSARYNPNYNKLMIMLDGTPSPSGGYNPNVPDEVMNIDTTLSSYLQNSQKQYRYLRTLKTVEIKGTKAKRPSHLDHPALSGLSQIPDRFVDGSQLAGCNLLLECLRVQLPNFTYDINEQKFYITRDYNSGSRVPAAIFVGGMFVDAVSLNATNPANVESVEVFLNDPLGTVDRMYNTRGVIVINTKVAPKGEKISKQAFLDMLPKKYEIKYYPKGYSKEREFYSPKYSPNSPINNNDLRSTIYWNPKLRTDEEGKAQVEFFNADGKGTYRVVIEGMDRQGHLVRSVYRYTVK